MMVKKFILFFLFNLILRGSLFSQISTENFNESNYQKATLFLKNKDTIYGFARIIDFNTVHFKKERNDKKVKFTHKKLVGLQLVKDNYIKNFKYKLLVGKGLVLLKKNNKGVLKLYTQSSFVLDNGVTNVSNHGVFFTMNTGSGQLYEFKRYYLSKKGSKHSVIKIWSDTNGRSNKTFRKRIVKYFKDCKLLVTEIKKGVFQNGALRKS
ncbi:MAG: Uncharacterised protein [Polaribacter sp. SA4-10]|nr:MAG: Uncharacterised protein [Polaribacter sp. SA4-10]